MNKKRDDEQSPKLSSAGSELKARLGLEPVLIDGVWHFKFPKEVAMKMLHHVPLETVMDYLKDSSPMEVEEACKLIREALYRLEYPSKNANGGDFQCGGAYWRLAKVLSKYLEPLLEAQEGQEHADFVIKNHGRIVKP